MLSALNRAHSLEIPDADVEFPVVDCDLDTSDLLEICVSDELWSELPELANEMSVIRTEVPKTEAHYGSEPDDPVESVNTHVAKDPSTPKLEKPKRSKRISSKAKIETLRSELKALTVQLQQLDAARRQETLAARALFTDWHRVKLWKQIAKRQLEQRHKSEKENATLRVMMNLQIQEAWRLKRLLKSRKKLEAMARMLGVMEETK